MTEDLRSWRTLVTGHPDGIFRGDAVSATQSYLRTSAESDPDLLDHIRTIAKKAPVRHGALTGLAAGLRFGDVTIRRRAAGIVPEVCRTGSDLLRLAAALRQSGGFGRLTRKALAQWYLTRPVADLASEGHDAVDGWTHRDVLRLCHVRAAASPRASELRRLARRSAPPRRRHDQEPATAGAPTPGRRLIAIDGSAAMGGARRQSLLHTAAQWLSETASPKDVVVTFSRSGWRDEATVWRTGIRTLNWPRLTAPAQAVAQIEAARASPPDPGLLVRFALARSLRVDAFVVLAAHAPWTDAADRRAALEAYRRWRRRRVPMVTVGLKSGGPSLGDTAVPSVWGIEGATEHTLAMTHYLAQQ